MIRCRNARRHYGDSRTGIVFGWLMNGDSTSAGRPDDLHRRVTRERLLEQDVAAPAARAPCRGRSGGRRRRRPGARGCAGRRSGPDPRSASRRGSTTRTTSRPSRPRGSSVPFSSVSQVAVRREVRERGEHPQRLLDGARYQRRVVEQDLPLVRVLHQRAHAAAVRRLGAVVARPRRAGRSPSRSRAPRASARRSRRGRARSSGRRSGSRAARRSASRSARRSRGCPCRRRPRRRRG